MRHFHVYSENVTKFAITCKRCKIGGKLVLITNRNPHTSFRLVPKLVTLNDLERRNDHSQVVAAVHPFGLSWAIVSSEIISQCATCILLCDNRVMTAEL